MVHDLDRRIDASSRRLTRIAMDRGIASPEYERELRAWLYLRSQVERRERRERRDYA